MVWIFMRMVVRGRGEKVEKFSDIVGSIVSGRGVLWEVEGSEFVDVV